MRFLGLESLLSFFPADATSEYTCFEAGSFRHLFLFSRRKKLRSQYVMFGLGVSRLQDCFYPRSSTCTCLPNAERSALGTI